jgi:hypothetical protein
MAPGTVCPANFPTSPSCLANRTALALDYGSIFEVYPSRDAIVRIDTGTTYLWYRPRDGSRRWRTGSFQLSLGFARRF